jgi:hypothetical protein
MSFLALQPQPLFIIAAANLQLTTDQAFTKLGSFTNWILQEVIATRVSGGATVACAGGIYSAASKAGVALLPAATSWLNLSGASKYVRALDPLTNSDIQTATPILSLTTGSTAAATARFLIFGRTLD